ncbi:DNA gyrase/topoisomerase IV subunit B [Candidatus Karelsulcia muelleri]|uniref:DNA topoisomerase (ATP-hydrolyzing) n=1 Tax=Candidatus Karelsulcia muelleri TaxID=336810 RepID=A0A3A1MM74_9FLAO|nr:DNA gyrase subunit B [Candidatus Karelsulcia muelleri]RIU86051.1 DNA gyrase subunit B [Candidatus Karelsulcia muelleri]
MKKQKEHNSIKNHKEHNSIKKSNENYTSKNIKFLDGIEHVRLRPSMYIGDIGIKGLHHMVYEVINNSIDESLSGFCDKIYVTIHKDNSITVLDNGRGIPVELHEKEGISALELVMTKIGAGGKFDNNSYKFSGGLHGVGISCVNALSSKLIAKIFRNGKIYVQKYSRGVPIYKLEIIGDSKNQRGTQITFKADKLIFKKISYNYSILKKRLRELSFLNKGLSISLLDEREISKTGFFKKNHFVSKKGIKEFLMFIDKNKESIIENYKSKKSRIKDFFYLKKKKKKLNLELVMRYNSSYKEKIFSYVNNINTSEGGTHVSGFKKALTKTFKKFFSKNRRFKKLKISGGSFIEGLTAILTIKIMNPKFEGQTKNKLVNYEIIGLVEKIVKKKLNSFLEKNTLYLNKILNKVFLSAKARQAYKSVRELIKTKTSKKNNLPIKLADCSSKNPNLCELYLVEGDSAGGTAKQGRERKFQAVLPLRGKILNVEKSIKNKIFENEEIKNIFLALGVFFLKQKNIIKLNIKKIRYKKIIIMTDADIDGSHISTLVLTFFFRYMRILIEKGYIYIATPPLFLIKNYKQKIYAWNSKEREKILKFFKKKSLLKGISIQRYKGLGEMNAEQLWETTMNPINRTLRKVTIHNINMANKIFSMLMGEKVLPRKQFIEKNALFAKIDN